MVTRPRLWLKTTIEKGPYLSCVVFTVTKVSDASLPGIGMAPSFMHGNEHEVLSY